MSPEYNIAFCRPGATFTTKWVRCWTNLAFYCAQNGIGFVDCPATFHNIHMVRDMCLNVNVATKDVKPFHGELDYTHMMWIDSDQVWQNEDFQKLLDADEDIVCGGYAMNGTEGRVGICAGWYDPKVLEEKKGMPIMKKSEFVNAVRNEKGLIDLGAIHPEYEFPFIGMGFMLVKKGVFESIEYPWFFDDNIRVGDIISNSGDDITFCKKATRAGYKIYLHPEVRVGHQKLHTF